MSATSSVGTLLRIAAIGMGVASMSFAQSSNLGLSPERAGSWDIFIPLIYTAETDVEGEGGSKATVNDHLGLGLAAGYNFNNHLQLGGSFNWNNRSYDATYVQEDGGTGRYNNDLETSTLALNGVYYILPGNITPFVSASVGYTFIDTNIQDGPTQVTCYYDPWWGYICDDYTPTRTESDFSYAAGLGLRVDFNEAFVMQFSYNKAWFNFDHASDNPEVDTYRIDFGFRYF